MERYSLSELSEKFKGHAEAQKKMHEEMIIKWKNEYSSDKLPEALKDDFCLPEALLCMVEEIKKLQLVVQDAQIRLFLESSASFLAPEKDSDKANT